MNAAQAFFPNGVVEADAIPGFVHAVTREPFEQLVARRAVTGEWVIYPQEDQNSYLCCCGHSSADHIHKDIIRYARRDFPRLKWFTENPAQVAQVLAEDLDALFRKGDGKKIQMSTSNYSMNELLCALDYDHLEVFCNTFLLAMLATLLQMDDIHLLDSFAMQSPKERLITELNRRGCPIEAHLEELKARGVTMTDFNKRRSD